MDKFNIVANDNQCGNMSTFDDKLKCLRERDFSLIAEYEHYSYTSANHTNVVVNGMKVRMSRLVILLFE